MKEAYFTGDAAAASFEARARTLLEAVARRPVTPGDAARWNVFTAIAKFGLGVDADEAERRLRAASESPAPEAIFVRYGLADAWLRFGRSLGEETAVSIRRCLLQASEYRLDGGTENHKLMRAVAGLTTAEAWPDWTDAADVHRRCASYLDRYCSHIVRFGQGEFDSTTYAVLYFASFATLRDFAAAPLLRRKAGMALDWLLANAAGEWLNGLYTGAHSRDYHPTVTHADAPGGIAAAWLYFGGRTPNLAAGEPHYAAVNALSAYRAPAAVVRAATERSRPFVRRETHDVVGAGMPTHDGNATRLLAGGALRGFGYVGRAGVRKYSYMAPGYALGSMTDGAVGDIVWSGQLRRWSLQWDAEADGSKLFFHHPFPDTGGEGERYVERWLGSSPYEQVLQHGGALIALYDIPEGGQYQYAPRRPHPSDADSYVDGFVPERALLRLEEDAASGWLFAHGDAVLIGVKPLRPYRWVGRDASGRRERLRCDGLRHAVVVQTADPAAYRGADDGAGEDRIAAELRRFRDALLARTRVKASGLEPAEDGAPPLAVEYETLSGDVLRFVFDGDRSVNGEAIDPDEWPLVEDPFFFAAVGEGALEAKAPDGRTAARWDFNAWTVTEYIESESASAGSVGGNP